MKTILRAGVSLVAVAAVSACLMGTTPAAAQDAATIQAIQAQIQQLQVQLKKLQADAARRDAALKQAQDDAADARAQAAAATAQAAEAQKAATTMQMPPVVAAAPPPPTSPPLPMGSFQVGGVTVTLGGFAALEGVYRSRNEASSIDTQFNSQIPYPNSPNYHIPEYRETAQQSRFSLLTTAQPDQAQKLTGYLEADFLSAGTSSNSNQSNSYTLRLRQFWGEYENSAWGLHVEGGQGWSLATLNKVGMLPRSEDVPLTIDAQYVVGFDWARQAELRVVKDFADQRFSAGFAVEEPQTIFSGSAGPNCLTTAAAPTVGVGGGLLEAAQCGGSNVNTIQAYSDNNAPDLIAKLAADPGFGHYEVYGLLRFFDGRVSYPTGATGGKPGTGQNNSTVGGGIGGGMILPVIPKMLDFQVSGLVGQGVGRYGTAQLPDVTFNTAGKLEPLSEFSIMGGFVGHPIPAIDVYAYGGAEEADRRTFTTGAVTTGYGNPATSLAGCEVELGTCSASTAGIVEGTLGAWWRVLKASYGTMQVGAQYAYVAKTAFPGAGATKGTTLTPTTNDNIFMVSFRYYPFQ